MRHWTKSGWMWMMPRSENGDKDSQNWAHLLFPKCWTLNRINTSYGTHYRRMDIMLFVVLNSWGLIKEIKSCPRSVGDQQEVNNPARAAGKAGNIVKTVLNSCSSCPQLEREQEQLSVTAVQAGIWSLNPAPHLRHWWCLLDC